MCSWDELRGTTPTAILVSCRGVQVYILLQDTGNCRQVEKRACLSHTLPNGRLRLLPTFQLCQAVSALIT